MYFNLCTLFFMFNFLILVFMLYNTLFLEMSYILEWNIYNFSSIFELKLYFYFDYISNFFMMIIMLISMSTFWYSKFYMMNDKKIFKFILLTLIFIFSMIIMILSMNMITIMMGWDGLGVSSYFLIIHYQSSYSNYSGMVTIFSNRMGDASMIFTIIMLMNFKTFDLMILNFYQNLNNLVLSCLIFSAFTKSAQFPFNTWLPLAMAAPTPISALVHSSTLVTAGIYLLIRFNFLFKNKSMFNTYMLMLPLLTMIIAGFSAIKEMDLKKIIAYSTLSQLGLMLMILLLGNEIMTFFHILTHAIFKALLFLSSGVFIHEHLLNQQLQNFSKIQKNNIFILSIFFICSLSLMGFPFLSGFYSKDLILEMLYSLNFNLLYVIMVIMMTIITTIYSIRIFLFFLKINKSNMKFIYLMKWDKIYNSFFLLFMNVLILGSVMNWMLVEKFNIMFMNYKIKMINLFLMIFGFILMFLVSQQMMNVKYMMISNFSMNNLINIQGNLSNFFLKKLSFIYFHSEFFIESMVVFKIYNFIEKINQMMMLFKFMYFLFPLLIYIYLLNI